MNDENGKVIRVVQIVNFNIELNSGLKFNMEKAPYLIWNLYKMLI